MACLLKLLLDLQVNKINLLEKVFIVPRILNLFKIARVIKNNGEFNGVHCAMYAATTYTRLFLCYMSQKQIVGSGGVHRIGLDVYNPTIG